MTPTETPIPPAPADAATPAQRSAKPPTEGAAGTTVDQVANVIVMAVPPVLVLFAAWRAWGGALHWQDLLVFAIFYSLTGLGITVGFHRLFTHRAFKTSGALRFVFAALGSAAVEGPVIEWVANHRMHHNFSDEDGDPHSPHAFGSGFSGALRGLIHAHMGWILGGGALAERERYARDLLTDPIVEFVDRTFVLWALLGLALPFGLGVALTGTVAGGLTAMLWGGAVRLFVLHHATFSVNSLCHFFGRHPYDTGDESRNLAWLAIPTFGEAWHNNHHAFPTSARHGQRSLQIDLSWWTIRALESLGLVRDVVRVSPERLARKA